MDDACVHQPDMMNKEPRTTFLTAMCLGLPLIANAATAEDKPFRPEPGKFPPLENAHSYRGELVLVDHATRRGSIRVQGSGTFFRNDPHPFAMLPYGIIRYHGAPADLRDIPLGTVMHVRAFLPPDPKISAVPVLPVDNKKSDANHNRGAGIAPAENHAILLEDQPSHCHREGMEWKLKEVDLKNQEGMITATREPKQGGKTDLIIEGIRPGRTVRVCPGNWPLVQVPREEYLNDGSNLDERFPTPASFPIY